ncbi:protein of unknown function [Ralstonia solanacearum CMR15]|nr:protein of unknown function [Ralstonia solanacearum CMR15]
MAGALPGNRTSSTDAVRACGGGSLYVVAQPASHSAPPIPAAIVRIVMRPPPVFCLVCPIGRHASRRRRASRKCNQRWGR